MNEFGIALLWCAVQVTALSLAAGLCYLVARRFSPSAGSLVTLTSLMVVIALSVLAFIDCDSQPFDDPELRNALFHAIREHHADVELVELPHHINDVEFAEAAAGRLMEFINSKC